MNDAECGLREAMAAVVNFAIHGMPHDAIGIDGSTRGVTGTARGMGEAARGINGAAHGNQPSVTGHLWVSFFVIRNNELRLNR